MWFNLKGTLKHNQLFLFCLLAVILLAVLLVNASFNFIGLNTHDQLTFVSPANFSNASGSLTLNATINYTYNTTGATNASFVFIHHDASQGYVYFNLTNATVNITAGAASNSSYLANTTFWNITIDTTTLRDGNYTITFNVTNATGGTLLNTTIGDNKGGNRSTANFVFAITIDNTAPNVSAASLVMGNLSGYGIPENSTSLFGYNFSAGLSEGNMTLQVVINDSTLTVQSVLFNISNGSGIINFANFTATRNQTNYTTGPSGTSSESQRGNFNLTKLAEGWYNLTIVTNDTRNNVNRSIRMAFIIDRTVPSVSVTCSPANPTAGQTVTCTCTHTDDYPGSGIVAAQTGFGTGSDTESTTATGSGSFTSGECRSRDYAGNLATATGSWTVTAASSGGGGGGGGGGGVSSGVATQFAKEVWTSINAGETAKVEVTNGAIGVTEVSFSVAETTYGAWVQVKKIDSLPSSVESFDNLAYRTLEITQQNVQKVLQGSATVKFKVEKAWLSDNSVNAANVALFRFVDGDWASLPTTQGEDDGTYVHYSATTTGFSYFVIGESETAVVPEAMEEAAGTVEEVAEVPAEEAGAAEAAGEAMVKKSNAVVWIVPLAVLLLVAGLLYWYWQRR